MAASSQSQGVSEGSNTPWLRLGVCVLVGALIWICPAPEGVDPRGWQVLAVFAATILSFILRPVPMAVMVIVGLVLLTLTQSFAEGSGASLEVALSGYGSSIVWLMVAAFLISGVVIETGVGRRVSLMLIHRLGRSSLGLAYGVGAAELVLAPFVASNTARGGGVLAPIVNSLCRTLAKSTGTSHRNPVSEFLIATGAHSNLITSAMFLTAMSGNVIVTQVARDVGGIEFGWTAWAMGAIVPGLAGLILLPLWLRFLVRPSGVDVGAARSVAKRELDEMGPMTRPEKIVIGVFGVMLCLWSTGALHHIHPTVVALGGVATILLAGAQSWKDMAANGGAWDAMVWLGGLITMAGALKDHGVIDWFADNARGWVGGMGGFAAALVLALIYFYSMYGFSMLTGHITAMAGAFFAVAVALDAPPWLALGLLAYFSNLCGCLTNYSSGPIIIYFGLGYITAPRWLKLGLFVSFFHIAVWLGIGLPWWKLLGWW